MNRKHSRRGPAGTIVLAILLCTSVADCKRQQTTKLCASDADCGDPVNLYCDLATGYCLCKTNAGCPSGQYCNAAGFCVTQSRCQSNPDCPTGQYCDTATNTCVQPGRCALDIQCPIGQVCDVNTSTCQAGCRSDGDCPLYQVCVCHDPAGSDTLCTCPVEGDVASVCPQAPGPDGGYITVPPGQCEGAGRCSTTSGCDFGWTCVAGDGGVPQCTNTYDPNVRPFCDNCVEGPGATNCGEGPNFCLTAFDPVTSAAYTYCGVDCSQGQACPNGYFCKPIQVVYGKWECATDSDCNTSQSRSTLVCSTDADCPNQGMCGFDPGETVGHCYGPCYKREGVALGFCSCILDTDCYQDTCDSVTRSCSVSKLACDPNAGGCVQTHCVDLGTRGACLIGYNCATITGLTCNLIAALQDAGF